MRVLKNMKSHPDVINYFKELPFYNTYIEKPKIEPLKHFDLLSEIPFYEESTAVKTNQAFKRYAMSYKVELIEKKYLLIQLETSKSSIEDLYSDLLKETKGFKYPITTKIFFKKYKSTEIDFSPVYFNATTKTVINHKFDLDKSFREVLYRIDNWINESSGWIVESTKSQYINISTFKPLMGSAYIKLPAELRNSEKGLIKIKNNDQIYFLWCRIKHINPAKIHPERITQKDQKLVNDLYYEGIEFTVSKNSISKIEMKSDICINFFCYENKLNYPVHITKM